MESLKEEVERANSTAVERMMEARPYLIGLEEASREIPHLRRGMALTHAGPPISWEKASGPLRGAIIGAALYEGWADNPERAERLHSRRER
jgi:Protein of unknown function (DUF1116).